MSIIEVFGLITIVIIGATLIIFLMIVLYGIPETVYYRIKRKGFSPPVAFFVVIGGIVISLFFSNIFDKINAFKQVIIFALTFIVYSLIIIFHIPNNQTRKFGRRITSIPWQIVGRGIQVLGISLLVYFCIKVKRIENIPRAIKLLVSSIPFGYAVYRFGKLFKNQEVENLNGQKPALFLRSFNLEMDVFWFGYYNGTKVEDEVGDLISFDYKAVFKALTFEEYFGNQAKKKLGGLEALGNPLDYAPKETLSIEYFDDKFWQTQFKKKLVQSSCILMQMGDG